jgi:formylglycine-generating enzyme
VSPKRVASIAGLGIAVVASSVGAALLVARSDLPLRGSIANLREAVPRKLKNTWRLVDGKHWQIVAFTSETQQATDALEQNRGKCMPGMVEVRGKMKVDRSNNPYDGSSIEEMQKTTCTKWINRDYPERCAEFDREKWLSISAELETKPMHFCMDRFEYPNERGQYPVIYVTWYEAASLCEQQGKRLCDEQEWTFACEGEEAQPYPYGYTRDAEACVVDQQWRPYNETAMRPRDGYPAMAEMDKLWQGVAAGSRPRCKSPFGIYDLTGNVDEWTRSAREGERPSILKGGYWGPVRTRCRPSTRSHDENHAFYQQGFRCCASPGQERVLPAFASDPSRAPIPRELR